MYQVTFEAYHLMQMQTQSAQEWMKAHVSYQDARGLENEHAATLMLDGRPIACAGVFPIWEGRAYLWCWLGCNATAKTFLELHRFAKRFLDGLPFRRVEAAVECDFAAGHRWVKALGFELEAPRMRCFEIDGRDSALYARVRV
jgi:RimJ/RimL family protein N-acetyltransferase